MALVETFIMASFVSSESFGIAPEMFMVSSTDPRFTLKDCPSKLLVSIVCMFRANVLKVKTVLLSVSDSLIGT